jgi:selenocysteine lyase/cysteine desulfurase
VIRSGLAPRPRPDFHSRPREHVPALPWRADFPAIAALQRQHQTYLDSAATTQKPQALLDALSHYYGHGAANVHRAQHLPGALATQAFETSRDKVAAWLNAGRLGRSSSPTAPPRH